MKLYKLRVVSTLNLPSSLFWYSTRQAADRAMASVIQEGGDPDNCSVTRYDIAYNKEGVINFLNTHFWESRE